MDPLQAWQIGVALADAVLDRPLGRQWAESRNRILARYDRLRTDPRSPLHDRVASAERLQSLAADWERQIRDLEALRADLGRRLAAGELLALGFEVTSHPTQRLVAVPMDAWQSGTIDWASSALRAATATYLDVRVLPATHRRLDRRESRVVEPAGPHQRIGEAPPGGGTPRR